MAILVLGGRGKTSRRLASLLDAANVPFLLASRTISPDVPYNQVQFDWLDPETYDTPFSWASSSSFLGEAEADSTPISAVYLVVPPVMDMVPPMTSFIDFARARGVRRFVVLSASVLEQGGPAMGAVHGYLASLEDVEFVVLRPTWFMGMYTYIHYISVYLSELKATRSPRELLRGPSSGHDQKRRQNILRNSRRESSLRLRGGHCRSCIPRLN